MNQDNAILADMKAGNEMTQRRADKKHGCWRLSARIFNLRERGYDIRMRLSEGPKKYGIYWLHKSPPPRPH